MKKSIQKISDIKGSMASKSDMNKNTISQLASESNHGTLGDQTPFNVLSEDSKKKPKESKVANLFKRIESGRKFAL